MLGIGPAIRSSRVLERCPCPPTCHLPLYSPRIPQNIDDRYDEVRSLTERRVIALPLADTAERARERLRAAVESGASLGPAGGPQDRRVRGMVTDQSIRLWVSDMRRWTRRKNWNIEFQGQLRGSPEGAVLEGVVDIPDRLALRWIMRLFRVGSAMPAAFVVVLAARQGIDPPIAMELASAIAIVIVTSLATVWMERSGERAAADDARLLVAFLRSEALGKTPDHAAPP